MSNNVHLLRNTKNACNRNSLKQPPESAKLTDAD